MDNRGTLNHQNRILPSDTVVCAYQVSLPYPPGIKKFLEYKDVLDSRFKGKSYLIMLEIMPVVTSEKNYEISVEPEELLLLLESLVACIKNNAQILKFNKTEIRHQDLSAGISSENLLHHIIADVIRQINPSAFIIMDKKHIQNDQLLVAEWNQFLQLSN
ncbi:MAG TPA: hypothetical protein VJ346_03880 [Bacteroidales bacterium]|nr:hypothetical protein [Bacteroidales bacterium]